MMESGILLSAPAATEFSLAGTTIKGAEGILGKKYPSKFTGVWYLQTSRHQSACCAAKLVMSQATRAVFICITLFIASTTSPSTQ
ncbi:hypothetical protein ACVWWU_000029 [Pantoea sp. PA1]|jgi:hypothetical protein|nr:hypothetical protein C7427_10295 [Pantoea ananatis]PWV92577.1 hypothetical protein C7426_10179 [Pantoea ananatis]QAB30171.1 hypothetical protein EPK90_10475 [Pantoea ananatis]RAR70957.1 hypothetical protein C7420_10474 [Pantoea ananatis]REC93225.1 hypothetical protein C7423_101622 [Pantoea ananatis]